MEVVGTPQLAAVKDADTELIGIDRRGSRTYFFTQKAHRQVVIAGYNQSGEFTAMTEELFSTTGDVSSVASCGDFVLFATPEGLRFVRYNNSHYTDLGGELQLPEFMFGTGSQVTLSTDLPETQLKSVYTNWSGTLTASDRTTLTKALHTAIDELRQRASTAGLCLEPILLRTALRLWDDSLIWSDHATIVGELWKLDVLAEVSDSSVRTVSKSQMKATAWMPTLRMTNAGIGDWASLVKAVEIYASDNFNNYPPLLFRAESKTGATNHYLRMKATDINEDALLSRKAQSSALRRVVTITDIASLTEGRLSGGNLTALGNNTYAITVSREEATVTPARHCRPYRPELVASVGTDAFAAHVKAELPKAPPLPALLDLADARSSVTTAITAVELSTINGTARVVSSLLTDYYALKTNKLITYPDSRAQQLSIIVIADGSRYSCDIPLTPSATGNFAYAVSADGFTLKPSESTSMPIAATLTESDTTTLLQCHGGNPLVWEQCKKAENNGIIAVMPTFRYGSSWTLGHSPVCLFAGDGLRLLSFSSAGQSTASTRISRRTVNSPRLVTATSEGLAFVDTGGEVCRFAGSKVYPTGIFIDGATAVAYSTQFDELHISSANSTIVVTADNGYYHSTIPFSDGFDSLITTNDTDIVDLNRETSKPIDVEARTVQHAISQRPKSVVWDIDASGDCQLQAEVLGENGHSCHGASISVMTLTGSPTTPLRHRLAAPRVRTIRLSLKGTMRGGDRLLAATLCF